MTVEEVITIMRKDPVHMDLTGYEYSVVRMIETDMRTSLYASERTQPDVELIWRSWYSLRIQMLQDAIDVCPKGYRWEALSLTC